ncbi:MAG TPA: ATP-binding protein [Chthoniobacteraceae bacterium]|nr:ATP-binding protein [Chthoniobacteraceae bacterium]
MKIWQKIVLGFGLALTMLAMVAVITYRSTRGLDDSAQWVSQRHDFLDRLSSFELHITQLDSAARGYLLAADEQYLPAYEHAREQLVEDIKGINASVGSDDPEAIRDYGELKYVQQLEPLLSRKTAILKAAIATRQEHGLESAALMLSDGQDAAINKSLTEAVGRLRIAEEARLQTRSNLSAAIGRSSIAVVVMATILSGVILALASVLILRDIAVRRRAEEAMAEEHNLLRSVMDAMPEQVFVTDREGHFMIDNISHRTFLGVKTAREIEGREVRYFFPASIADQMEKDNRVIMETGRPVLNHEDLLVRNDGQVAWIATTRVPLRDVEGHCIGLVGVSRDVSERKEAEERLRLAAEQLRRSNLELQEFASIASHDLQEPLRKIQAFGDRLKSKCAAGLGENGRDYLERMQDAARRMQILLHDLLTLSRVTSKALPFEPVDLRKIAEDVVSDLEVRIEQTQANVEIGRLPVIDADPVQMRQLIQNLLSNALKFQRPEVTPEVIVSAKVLDNADSLPGAMPGEELCQIVIKDNGIGFDERYLDRIFQVFQRLHSRSEYEGTGIGLAVCRKIADRHGGAIYAKSAEGEGATFIVTLPVKQRMSDNNEEAR